MSYLKPKIGEILVVLLPSGIKHWGIRVSPEQAISSSKRKGKVALESLAEFSSGYPIVSKGYPSKLNPATVLKRAYGAIGQPWRLFSDNCQHFATWCHQDRHSPQLRQTAFWIAASGLIACLFGKTRNEKLILFSSLLLIFWGLSAAANQNSYSGH